MRAYGLFLHLRKRVAQAGVLLQIAAALGPVLAVPFSVIGGPPGIGIAVFTPLLLLSGPVLLLAALLPGTPEETWGSMWPLVGYDNAIDGLFVRGPWWQRFYELDEQEAQNRVAVAMGSWFR